MKKRVLSGFLTLFLTVGAVFGSVAVSDQVYAADVSVSGTVIGTDGKSTVSGANIVLRDKSDCTKEYTAVSGDDGTYTIADVPEGTYQATAYQTNKNDSSAVVQTVTVTDAGASDVKLQFPVDLSGQMVNPGFAETKNDLTGWSNSLGQSAGGAGFRTEYKKDLSSVAYAPWAGTAFDMDMYQTVSNLANGTYVVSCYAKCGWGDDASVSLYAKDSEGNIIASEELPSNVNEVYQEIGLTAEVKDGTITIGIAGNAAAGGWANIDDFHLGLLAEPQEDEQEETVDADYVNDSFWTDTEGDTIYSQGGGIFEFDGKYYWYGVKYTEAVDYANDPRTYYTSSDVFEGITCYSSTDLKNWKYEGLVAEPDDVYNAEIMGTTKPYSIKNGKTTWLDGENVKNTAVWVGRLGVTKLSDGTYALLVQHECADYDNALDGDTDQWSKQVLVMTSDSPNGKFTWNNRINMKSAIGTSNTGDQTVFVDDDGTGWLVYSYGSGRGKMYLSKIEWNADHSKVVLGTPYMVYQGPGREGNCMFKYNGKYYLCASDLYGWNASHGYYMTIDPGEMSLEDYLKSDDFTVTNELKLMDGTSDDFCHVSQTGFFYTLEGTEQTTVLFCGDRWSDFAGNGLGYNQWCPLSFDEDGTPYFNSLSAWNLDEITGKWSVAAGNNYVKNGSFEADRVKVDNVAGWTQVTNKGSNAITNNVKIGDDTVTGKGSLKLGSTSAYDVEVSQKIASSSYVNLEDGVYKMTAKVKNSGNFDNLQMYAVSGGKTYAASFTSANPLWTTVKVDPVIVKGNEVTVGFLAAGTNSECLIDDVTFTAVENPALATGSITGKVTGDAASKGKVLTVTAANASQIYSVEVTLTGEAQDYAIENLADGTYTVSFAAKNCVVPDPVEVTVADGQAAPVENKTITNNAGNAKGKVVDGSASGIADVTVTLSKDGSEDITVSTGADGSYEFADVEAGTYTITFEKRGYQVEGNAPETVEIVLNDTKTIDDVVLARNAGTVAGTVVDSCGQGISGMHVSLRDKSSASVAYTTDTDENGAYQFNDVVQGNYIATATSMNAEDAWKELNAGNNNIVVEPNQTVNVDLQVAADMTSKIVNPTFDTKNDLSGWTNGAETTGGYRTGKNSTHGTYQLAPWAGSEFTMDTYQTITGLTNGTYIVTCWSNTGYLADTDKLELYAKDGNGTDLARESIQAEGSYQTIALLAEVTDGTLTIGVDGNLAANSWANIDDFHLGLLGKYHANAKKLEETKATCGEAGHGAYWSCPDCKKFFKDSENGIDLSTAYDNVEDVTVVIPATGEHTYGDPVFTWTKDHAACTAAFTCAVCKDEVTENATVTSAVTKAASCKEEGVTTYTATVTFAEKTYTDTATEAIAKTGHTYVKKTEADGSTVEICDVCGDIKSRTPAENNNSNNNNNGGNNADNGNNSNISAVGIGSVTLAKDAYNYTGKAIKPAVIAKDTAGNVIDASDYTVAYAANKNVGTATVTVTFSGQFTGTKTLDFVINPKGTKITKVAAKSKSAKITWKKQSVQVTGYEIRYSTSKKFRSAKSVLVKKAKTRSKVISKLKGKKKYYVQVRTYKTVKGMKYYSNWSNVKAVTPKK